MRKDRLKKVRLEIVFILVALSVILVWFILPLYMNYLFKYDDSFDLKGKFGDMYNVATSLFGAITIILLLYNTYLTRIELSANRIEFKKQNNTLKYQRFDTTFFNLLKLNLEIIDEISSDDLKVFNTRINSYNMMAASKNDFIKRLLKSDITIVLERLNSFGSSMFYFISWILQEKKKDGREKYLPFVFSQLREREIEFLYYYFNTIKIHPRIKEFDRFMLETINDDHRIFKLKNTFEGETWNTNSTTSWGEISN